MAAGCLPPSLQYIILIVTVLLNHTMYIYIYIYIYTYVTTQFPTADTFRSQYKCARSRALHVADMYTTDFQAILSQTFLAETKIFNKGAQKQVVTERYWHPVLRPQHIFQKISGKDKNLDNG